MTFRPLRPQVWGLRSAACLGAVLMLATTFGANAAAQSDEEAQKARAAVEEARREVEKQRAMAIEQQQRAAAQFQELMRQLEAQRKEFELQKRSFEAQQKKMESQRIYEQMRAGAQPAEGEGGPREKQAAESLAQMVQQLEAARKDLGQLEMLKQKVKAAPLPDNAQTRVFALRYGEAAQLVGVLGGIVGDRGLRMAVDERSNSLVVSADDKTMSIVEALLMKLDKSADKPAASTAFLETLQLRIVWLLDGVDGKEPTSGLVSPQVLEALQQLGFELPAVVCQQVTTMTLGEDKGRGRFQFAVPVLVNGQLWQLGGNGLIAPLGDDQFALQFELQVGQQDNPQKGRLGGSIYTPLGHYTVMGTTTFVEEDTEVAHSDGSTRREPAQHLSAFVVYLDRAPEFPVEKSK